MIQRVSKRKFRVVANETMSEDCGCLSISLSSVYLMISDIDKELKESIVRCFAGDT